MTLARFRDPKVLKIEPIYKNLAEVSFNLNGNEFPELTESLIRIEGKTMFFNFNWYPEQKNLFPLRLITSLLKETLGVDVRFHDRSGTIMYIIKLNGFRFKKVNLKDLDKNSTGTKELEVSFEYDFEEILMDWESGVIR